MYLLVVVHVQSQWSLAWQKVHSLGWGLKWKKEKEGLVFAEGAAGVGIGVVAGVLHIGGGGGASTWYT